MVRSPLATTMTVTKETPSSSQQRLVTSATRIVSSALSPVEELLLGSD